MLNPLDNWEASIAEGKAAEAAIAITFFTHLGMYCEDNTKENVKNTDLRGNSLLEVKILRSPYPSAKSPAGLPPEEHLTLDHANIIDADPRVMILMVVDYTGAGLPTKGLFFTTIGKVQSLVAALPKRVYNRSTRSSKDKVKKIGISTRECGRIAFPGMTLPTTVDEILRAQKHPLSTVLHPPEFD